MVSMTKAIGGIVVIAIIIAALALSYGKAGSSSGSPDGSGSTGAAAPTVPAPSTAPATTVASAGSSSTATPAATTAPPSGGASYSVALSNAQGQFVITPNVIKVSAGQSVTLNVTNDGTMTHGFTVPGLNVSSPFLPPGQSYTLKFTAPSAAGNYTYYCPVDSHRELGMVGTLVVKGS